jgi:hypothetical protein
MNILFTQMRDRAAALSGRFLQKLAIWRGVAYISFKS